MTVVSVWTQRWACYCCDGCCSWHKALSRHRSLFTPSWEPVQPLIAKRTTNEAKVTELCPTLCDSMNCTVPEILQARILECITFPFSRGLSQPRDQIQVFLIAGRFFTSWAIREAYNPRPIPLRECKICLRLQKISTGLCCLTHSLCITIVSASSFSLLLTWASEP